MDIIYLPLLSFIMTMVRFHQTEHVGMGPTRPVVTRVMTKLHVLPYPVFSALYVVVVRACCTR